MIDGLIAERVAKNGAIRVREEETYLLVGGEGIICDGFIDGQIGLD